MHFSAPQSTTSPRAHLKTSKSNYTAAESSNITTVPSTITASVSLSPKRSVCENAKNALSDDQNASLRNRGTRNSFRRSPARKMGLKSELETENDKASNLLTLLSELEQSLPMFATKWRVVDLFGGLQIWQESKDEDTHQSAEQLNGMLASSSTAALIAFLAGGIGGGGIAGALILSLLAAVAAFWSMSSPRLKKSIPSFKTVKVIDESPDDICAYMLDLNNLPTWDASVENAQVVQAIDQHSDMIHIVYRPTWVWPFWILPRDLCLLRYWRRVDDGTFIICMQSAFHPECPPLTGIVRAQCKNAGYIIAPRHTSEVEKITNMEDLSAPEIERASLVTAVVHMDPRGVEGNLLRRCNAMLAYLRPQLLALAGLQEDIEARKFVHPDLSDILQSTIESSASNNSQSLSSELSHFTRMNGDKDCSVLDSERQVTSHLTLFPSNIPREMWEEPEVTMPVRGPDYLVDRRKIPSAPPAFHLVGLNLFESEEALEHYAAHPNSVIQQELARHEQAGTEMPFTFLINFMVPGNPRLSVILFYQSPSMEELEPGTSPFADLMVAFIEGSEEFRNERFKLIPSIAEGSFIVRQAVGTTPAIIGKKLRQPVYVGQRPLKSQSTGSNSTIQSNHATHSLPLYLELDVDIASSAVANRVVGLVTGYTKKLIIDMGFVLEAREEEELPERLFGTCRLNYIDLGLATKL
uniref:Uncharacterized protein AlNc14C263G9843 n=1 Tax=Albugo laibachii Nc14 TaxID=890382 RepID=F0WU20_9STRA|nr:conserved hypothetical protein [Albugo laibachii Nc14]CCA24949.1 conserved hypothetical protein [Albugo laibachii Nc14]|eukprot:CCA24949.1 conserved hypothetical protein [Albugo laibachii Nc14]